MALEPCECCSIAYQRYNTNLEKEWLMRIFVTGATGFAGSHLVDLLLDEGHEIYALVHRASGHQPLPSHKNFNIQTGDLLDLDGIMDALKSCLPDVILHLAGQASPSQSWRDPAQTFAINTGGTANILEAALNAGKPRTVIVTSAEIYGRLDAEFLPITEDVVPNPGHPYGISKWAAGRLVQLYHNRYGLPVIEARPFNHIGPRQLRGFVVPDFASQLAAIKADLQAPIISVGNLNVERDFTDVRDVVRAYRLLVDFGQPGEPYLICSGRAVAVQQLLDMLIEIAGIDVRIEKDSKLTRKSEISKIFGSYAKLERDTGWRPQIGLQRSLADTLVEWERKLAS
jgi:GDP-4-dehydro-6-deoxy-D-mannose reductase